MKFSFYSGLGNTYLVAPLESEFSNQEIVSACRRYASDGLLVGKNSENSKTDFHLRVFNPDGSEAEKSGNGIRIFAYHLWKNGLAGRENPLQIHTLGGQIRCEWVEEISSKSAIIRAEMGEFQLQPATRIELELLGAGDVVGYPVDFGNPHFVIPFDFDRRDPKSLKWMQGIGREVERCFLFKNRTNVEFLKILSDSLVEAYIWERGVGPTLSSGTGASAVAAVASEIFSRRSPITVRMPGGDLKVEVEGRKISIQGPIKSLDI